MNPVLNRQNRWRSFICIFGPVFFTTGVAFYKTAFHEKNDVDLRPFYGHWQKPAQPCSLMWISLSGIAYGLAIAAVLALFILGMLASLIALLVERGNTGRRGAALKSRRWLLPHLAALPCSLGLLLALGQGKDFVRWLDHSAPGFFFFCLAPYALVYAQGVVIMPKPKNS